MKKILIPFVIVIIALVGMFLTKDIMKENTTEPVTEENEENYEVTEPYLDEDELPEWTKMEIGEIKLPIKYGEFTEKTGYVIPNLRDEEYLAENQIMSEVVLEDKEGNILHCELKNFYDVELGVNECYITSLTVSENQKMELIPDVRLGDDKDKVLDIMGESYEEEHYENLDMYAWAYNEQYRAVISFMNGKCSSISILTEAEPIEE